MPKLTVLWDRIVLCKDFLVYFIEILNINVHKYTQNQKNQCIFSFVIQMLKTIWKAESGIGDKIMNWRFLKLRIFMDIGQFFINVV